MKRSLWLIVLGAAVPLVVMGSLEDFLSPSSARDAIAGAARAAGMLGPILAELPGRYLDRLPLPAESDPIVLRFLVAALILTVALIVLLMAPNRDPQTQAARRRQVCRLLGSGRPAAEVARRTGWAQDAVRSLDLAARSAAAPAAGARRGRFFRTCRFFAPHHRSYRRRELGAS